MAKKIGWVWALITALATQLFWPFYEASLWSFNPFLLVPLAVFLIVFLTKFLSGQKKFYYYSLFIIFLSLNSDLAGAAAFILFFTAVGFIGFRKSIIPLKSYLITAFFIPFIAVIGVLKEFVGLFIRTKVIAYEALGIGVFTGTNFTLMAQEFFKILGGVTFQQNTLVGVTIFVGVCFLYFGLKKSDKGVKKFALLTLGLTLVSYLFFSTNRGWRDWHTAYLSPLLFITFILMLSRIKKVVAVTLLCVVLLSQITYFSQRLTRYMEYSDDPSILYNEISAVDWIYQNSESQGFSVYNYTDRFYDYSYQYLFWWHGLKKYGYLPCEYANFPLSAKELYVEGYDSYLEPRRGCDRLSFLIIESETNGNKNKEWIEKFRVYHELVETKRVGRITIEKYYRKIGAPSDVCIWWNRC